MCSCIFVIKKRKKLLIHPICIEPPTSYVRKLLNWNLLIDDWCQFIFIILFFWERKSFKICMLYQLWCFFFFVFFVWYQLQFLFFFQHILSFSISNVFFFLFHTITNSIQFYFNNNNCDTCKKKKQIYFKYVVIFMPSNKIFLFSWLTS